MKVDLASALDARSNEGTRGERAEGERDGAFPTLLRSSLDRTEAGRGREAEAGERSREDAGRGERSEGEQASEARTEAASDRASERTDRDEARAEQARSEDEPRDGAGDDDPDEGRPEAEAESRAEREAMEEEAASQGAMLGAVGGSVASRLVVAAEAEQAIEGRLTALDAEGDVDPETEAGRKASAAAVEAIAAGDGAIRDAELGEAEASEARAALEAAALSSEEGGARGGDDPATATTTVSASAPEAPREARVAPETGDAAIAVPVAERDVEIAAAGAAAEDRGDAPRDSGEEARDPGFARQPAGEQVEVDRAAEGALSSGVDPNLRQAIANGEQVTLAADEVAIAGAAAVASPVAGQAVETTTSATPGAPTPVAASEAISVQTEWLATRGGGTARLVLHPPELGEMAIRVTLRGSTVDVVMVAQEAVAQTVAEEQGDRLAQALQARDLRMDQFEVRRGDPEGFSEGDLERFAGSGADRDDRAEDERGGAEEGETRRDLLGRRRGGAEHAPQIVSLAPERGVDLRI